MATIVSDTLSDYGTDAEGGRVHDTLGTRCDPYVSQMLSGVDFDYHCHSNLVRAILPFGLTEFDVHDVPNVFQCTGLNDNDGILHEDLPCTTRETTSSSSPSRTCSRPCPPAPAEISPHRCSGTVPQTRWRTRHPLKVTVHRLAEDSPRRLDRTDFAEPIEEPTDSDSQPWA